MIRKLLQIPTLERDVAIYLAGLIDGEGCFYINRAKKHPTTLKYCYSAAFKIVLTDEKTIKRVAEKLKRSYTHVLSRKDKNHKDTYMLRISDRVGLVNFISQIISHMITKKEVAQFMLDFCKSRIRSYSGGDYHVGYNDFEISLYDKIKNSNRVGIETKLIAI